MSIEQLNVVDFASINQAGEAVLTISDHLDWVSDNNHLYLLQEKVNGYISFIESGQFSKSYPDCIGRKVVVSIRGIFDPSFEAERLFFVISRALESIDVRFEFIKSPLVDDKGHQP